ncbi:hypothetical protein LK08_22740 [Streptomyces sp. MUSC 125]|uniref:hypothetical protein n=1 Tax=unclassified Streptomyces TaxID=2593676 RepID=UPI00057E65D0|nr:MULTISPECIES: hypothetical protein [unclassified Streptomyces]KIE24711.1 hypothetical protein LK08_22740 [Streptomyces sp. MUSC 125]MCH0560412.1 hypothetical protein [Streptomyces sp. MUM 16J]
MTKLPDNEVLRQHYYADGLSDKQIATMYGCTVQAVNQRFGSMEPPIQRKPWTNKATAILEAAFPTRPGFKRSEYTHLHRARSLYAFMRWRLGDPTLSARQVGDAQRFARYARDNHVILGFDPERRENPWQWLPREDSDGDLLLRWPAGREMPKEPHLKAITLPEC